MATLVFTNVKTNCHGGGFLAAGFEYCINSWSNSKKLKWTIVFSCFFFVQFTQSERRWVLRFFQYKRTFSSSLEKWISIEWMPGKGEGLSELDIFEIDKQKPSRLYRWWCEGNFPPPSWPSKIKSFHSNSRKYFSFNLLVYITNDCFLSLLRVNIMKFAPIVEFWFQVGSQHLLNFANCRSDFANSRIDFSNWGSIFANFVICEKSSEEAISRYGPV